MIVRRTGYFRCTSCEAYFKVVVIAPNVRYSLKRPFEVVCPACGNQSCDYATKEQELALDDD